MHTLSKLAAAIALATSAIGAHAAIAQIQLQGLNLNFNEATGTFCDNGGGIGCFGAEDLGVNMTFWIDGVYQGVASGTVGLNMLMFLGAGIDPTVNASHNLLNSGADVFDFEIDSNPGLFTDIASGQVTFSNTSVNATGTGFSEVFAQNLPFGLTASDPINWSFSAGLGSCEGAVGSRVCTYAGTGELAWTIQNVPEPVSLALVGSALFAMGAVTRRRRKV